MQGESKSKQMNCNYKKGWKDIYQKSFLSND